jgi:hypothetical protein
MLKGGGANLATEEEVVGIRDGKLYLAVYGVIAYRDVFGVDHWTHFCKWEGENGTFQAKKCTQYNSVDSN